jgi:hypothetical protein
VLSPLTVNGPMALGPDRVVDGLIDFSTGSETSQAPTRTTAEVSVAEKRTHLDHVVPLGSSTFARSAPRLTAANVHRV